MAAPTTEPVPIDAVVLLEMLGLAVIVACWLLLASRRASESSARPLIRSWAAVVAISSTLASVSIAMLGTLVAAGGRGFAMAHEDCEGIWMEELTVFGAVEKVSVLGSTGWKFALLERQVGVPTLIFSALALLGVSLSTKPHTTAGEVDMEQNAREIREDKPGGLLNGRRLIDRVAQVMLWLVLPAIAIFMMVSTEQYLLTMTPKIPSVEEMSSVGQWDVWAATGAVLVATLINAVMEKLGLRKNQVKFAHDQGETVTI